MNRNREFFKLESTASTNGASTNGINNSNPKLKLAQIGQQANISSENNNESLQLINQLNNESSKALFKIELDDVGEKENVYLLLDYGRTNKKGFFSCSTEVMPGLDKFETNVQMFTSVYRCEISSVQLLNQVKFNEICEEILESLR